jgi:hypothetical protein
MKLPNLHEAVVPQEKVADYLLSDTHPVGRGKAGFFSRFGFRPEEWMRLAEALRDHGTSLEVARTQDTEFGTRYIVEGPLDTPDGRRPLVRSVWFIRTGAAVPRFVSAYPLARSES